jgi:hypothetical protein
MAKKDNSAAVDNDEYFQEPIIIPKLDLCFLLHVDGKSIKKSSSNSDISVLLYSEQSMFTNDTMTFITMTLICFKLCSVMRMSYI